MNADQETSADSGSNSDSFTAAPTESQPEKTFAQEDVTRIAAREKDEGKRAGQRAVLQELGFDSIEEAQSFRRQLDEAESAKLSEVDRAKKEAERDREDAARDRLEAASMKHSITVERVLVKQGLDQEIAEEVSQLVKVDVGSTQEEISTAIAELKQKMPQLFTSVPGATGTPKIPNGDPGRAPSGNPPQDPEKAARDRLNKRHGAKISNRKP